MVLLDTELNVTEISCSDNVIPKNSIQQQHAMTSVCSRLQQVEAFSLQ